MRKATWLLVAIVAVVAVASALASPTAPMRSTKTTTLTAFLTVNQSIPAPKKGARGSGKFTATVTGRTIKWRITFRGMTGPVVAAHIHSALAGRANPAPAVGLCGPCKSGQTGMATASAAVLKKILGGATYVNLHTAKNAGGEIRGQIASS